MKPIVSSKIIPLFYILIGIVFVFVPRLPLSDIKESISNSTDILEGLHRIIGVIFFVFGVLVSRISVVSINAYRLLNGTFIFIFILMSSIGPIFYYAVPSRPIELLLFTGINISFVLLYIWERKE